MAEQSTRRDRLLYWGALGFVGIAAGARLLALSDPSWLTAGIALVGTFLVVGPLAWLVRERLAETARENLSWIAWGLVFASPVVLALFALAGGQALLQAAVFGGVVGIVLAATLEVTVLPAQYRGVLTGGPG